MEIPIKTAEEIEIMREGGRILGNILQQLKIKIRPGITTDFLNKEAEKLFKQYKVEASFKGYRGYPASICTSVNEEIVHGIPGKKYVKEGDIITIDAGVFHRGFHVDSAITVAVGDIAKETKIFLQTTKKALENAIRLAQPGIHFGDISHSIQKTAENNGYAPIRDLSGHGIGKKLHEPPQIPNYGKKGTGPVLKPGMTFAIEPIFAMKKRFTEIMDDKWTVITRDRSLSCQYEHTIAIQATHAEILTLGDI